MTLRSSALRVTLILAVVACVCMSIGGTASARPLSIGSPTGISSCQPDTFGEFYAENDSYNTPGQTLLSVPAPGVLANDLDIVGSARIPILNEGLSIAAYLYAGPSHGTVALNTDGSFTYTSTFPVDGSGTDSFQYLYQVGGSLVCSTVATVTINISPVQPVATQDLYTVASDQTLSVGDPSTLTGSPTGVLTNDVNSISGGNGNLYAVLVDTSHLGGGTLTWPTSGPGAEDGSFTYTPASPTTPSAWHPFSYEACYFIRGGVGPYCSAPMVDYVGVLPTVVGQPDSYSVAEGRVLNVGNPGDPSSGVLGNDVNNTGQFLTATVTQGPAHGSLVFNVDGVFTYTPTPGYYSGGAGPDTFTYTLCAFYQGVQYCSAPTTVSITVASVPPTAAFQAPAKLKGQPFVVTFTDPAGQAQVGVQGVSSSDLTITAAGSTTPLAEKMVCQDYAGTTVNCAENVSAVLFTPSATLTAGQTYQLNVLAGICQQDPFARCVSPQTLSVRAATVVGSTDPGPTYQWGTVKNVLALGGSYVQEQYAHASEKYSFSGTSMGLVMWGRPDGGTATVTVTSATNPKTQTTTIDTYAVLAGDQTFSWPSLPAGKHTVTITTTGSHDANQHRFVGQDRRDHRQRHHSIRRPQAGCDVVGRSRLRVQIHRPEGRDRPALLLRQLHHLERGGRPQRRPGKNHDLGIIASHPHRPDRRPLRHQLLLRERARNHPSQLRPLHHKDRCPRHQTSRQQRHHRGLQQLHRDLTSLQIGGVV